MSSYDWVRRVSISRVPGSCYCPLANGRQCDLHAARPDWKGNRAQRRAAKKAGLMKPKSIEEQQQ